MKVHLRKISKVSWISIVMWYTHWKENHTNLRICFMAQVPIPIPSSVTIMSQITRFRQYIPLERLQNHCEQESPPAWTQETYHPPSSKYSLFGLSRRGRYPHPWPGWVPILGTHSDLARGIPHTWLGEGVPPSWPGQGVPYQWGSTTTWGTPILTWLQGLGYPILGTTYPTPGTWVPPERKWDQWKYYGMQMSYPQKGHGTSGSIMVWRWGTSLGVDIQTPAKTIPSRRTTYAGGKNVTHQVRFLQIQIQTVSRNSFYLLFFPWMWQYM